MSYSTDQILLAIVAYLSVLFLVGYFGDRGNLPSALTRHPAIYVLSLGVIGGGMVSNGVFSLAAAYGNYFLLYYLGIALMFMFAVLLLRPVLRLCRVHQLASLADVLTFRYRSRWVGVAVTLAMCLTLMPLLALQIRAVADSIQILAGLPVGPGSQRAGGLGLALVFCVIITGFAILFGTRNATNPNRNPGLVAAIAFESMVKLLALFALMLIAVYEVFGGFGAMQEWLATSPEVLLTMRGNMPDSTARTILLLFFTGAVCMPHIFHMAFAENSDSGHLRTATWGLPLYLLLLGLPVLPTLWAAAQAGQPLPPAYSGLGLGIALESPLIGGLAFAASLSAASAVIIVATLALANMCVNYLVLPSRLLSPFGEQNLYRRLQWVRRALITALILGGFAFFSMLDAGQSLPQLALLSFSGTLHFFPALVFTPYWPRANRAGLLAGLGLGLLIWCLTLLLPVLSNNALGLAGNDNSDWTVRCIIAVLVNCAVFIVVSLLLPRTAEEKVAAEVCSMDSRDRPYRRSLALASAQEFAANLAPALGREIAQAEVARALSELRFSPDESRPYALRHLRARIEANLSGMLGPAAAMDIVGNCLPFTAGFTARVEDYNLLERRLERSSSRFTGLAADLDNLRRHYRRTVDELPVGLCTLSADGEVLLWNSTMAALTSVSEEAALGSRWTSLPEPWREAIELVLQAAQKTPIKREMPGSGGLRWINLQCSASGASGADRVVVAEDITEFQLLQDELLHNERLASIGRLAAGVAHEIGNPITGIACLAQNLAVSSDPDEARETSDEILRQTQRVSRIVESLVNFSHLGSRASETRSEPCNLADCVDEAVHLLSLDLGAPTIHFRNTCDRELLALGDNQRLLQVVINLLDNARDASADGAEVTISTNSGHAQNHWVEVYIDDRGHGIAPEHLPRVLEPFFTTKDVGKGTGLGLPLAYSIVEDMGGSLRIESPGPEHTASGTRVVLQLSRASYDDTFGQPAAGDSDTDEMDGHTVGVGG